MSMTTLEATAALDSVAEDLVAIAEEVAEHRLYEDDDCDLSAMAKLLREAADELDAAVAWPPDFHEAA
jgi:hypothetical protein